MESNISTNTSHGNKTYYWQSKQSQHDQRIATSSSSTNKKLLSSTILTEKVRIMKIDPKNSTNITFISNFFSCISYLLFCALPKKKPNKSILTLFISVQSIFA